MSKVRLKGFVDWFSWITGGLGHIILLLNIFRLLTGYYSPPPGHFCATSGAWAFIGMGFIGAGFYILCLISQGILIWRWPEKRSSKIRSLFLVGVIIALVAMLTPFLMMFFF